MNLYYQDAGRGGIPLVFAHGLGADHHEFGAQVRYFASHGRCVAFDQRGFGLSPPVGELTIRNSVRDLAGLVDALGIDRFVLVGHSMGSMVAYSYVLENPERVEKLIIIGGTAAIAQSPAVYLGMLALPLAKSLLDDRSRKRLMKALALNVATRGAKKSTAGLMRHYFEENPSMFTDQYYAVCLEYVRDITRFDCRDRLWGIRCPTLIIHGMLDAGITLNSALAASAIIRGAKLHVMPDCGHSPNVEEPKRLNEIMADFLK